ncbi:MAG TPA: ABC transporter permease [Blastocatellia bacterium]|nr:ABC transporter permease [Blastocatellia bacterium]
MTTLWQDLRYGARMLLKHKGVTAIAILSLALGIGANTAIFSLVDAVLLKSLPVKEPEQLAQFKWLVGRSVRNLSAGNLNYNGSSRWDDATKLQIGTSFQQQTFEQFRAEQRTLTDLFAFAELEQVNANVDGHAEVASGMVVSGGYFSGLGVQPVLGRAITADDDRSNAPAVAVISFRFWERRFSASPAVIGKQINLNNAAFTIIGVTPREFAGVMGYGDAPDLTIPLMMEPLIRGNETSLNQQGRWWLLMMGRLKPGATLEQARAELDPIFQRAALEYLPSPATQSQAEPIAPQDYPRVAVETGRRGDTHWSWYQRQSLYLLTIVVGLVLSIACVNVANLLLARAAERQKEIAVRLALGAGRFRLVRQLLTESVFLALAGGALGLLFALWGRDLLLNLGFSGQEMSSLRTGLDARSLAFTFAVSVLTGLLFGLIPAWRATRVDLAPALKDTGRSSSGHSRSLAGKSLVVAQVALSVLLLIGAGLFLRTLRNLQHVAPGFNTQNLLLFRVDPRLSGYEGQRLAQLYQRMFDRIEAVPSVRSVTFSRHPLLSGSSQWRGFDVVGRPADPNNQPRSLIHIVRANFFEMMEIPIQLGRSLRPQDEAQAPRVTVVNQAFARRFFHNENPIGKRLRFGPDQSSEAEIVGLAQDAKYTSLRDEIPPTVYVLWLQELPQLGQMNFEVRAAGDPANSIAAIRQAVREVDGNLPLFDVKTQVEQASQSLAQERLFAALLSFFGALALSLAALGLYGVLAHSVTQRTKEIGLRIALGAETRHVLRLVIWQGMLLVCFGIALGLTAAYWLTKWLSSWMYGVDVKDPLTFGAIALLLACVALLACWIPARRAAKVDPMVALRCE